MNYASDASVEMSKNGLSSATYVSTSFYDRKLCISQRQFALQFKLGAPDPSLTTSPVEAHPRCQGSGTEDPSGFGAAFQISRPLVCLNGSFQRGFPVLPPRFVQDLNFTSQHSSSSRFQ